LLASARVVQVGRAASADVQLSADLMRAKSLNLRGYAAYHVAHNVRAVAYQRLAQFRRSGVSATQRGGTGAGAPAGWCATPAGARALTTLLSAIELSRDSPALASTLEIATW
jgi:hypothetical protein